MKITALTLGFIILSAPAWAAQPSVSSEALPPLPGGNVTITGEGAPVKDAPAVIKGESAPISVTDAATMICQSVDIMSDVKGPEYVPGVDVNGNAVAPADVNSTPVFSVPERIDMPVEVDVLNAIGLQVQPMVEMTPVVGTISVLKGGKVLYNGQDRTADLQTYCQTHPSIEVNIQKKTDAKQ